MKNANEIKKNLEKYIAEHEAKAAWWKKVERLTKKDGSGFKVFSKNFKNARIYANYMQRNVIAVGGWVNGSGYIDDELDLWEYVDHTELNPEEHTIIKESPWSREYFYLTVDEVFAKIEKRIQMHEKYVKEYKEQLEKTESVFKEFAEAIDKALATMAEKAGKNSSLYYQCREYMERAY